MCTWPAIATDELNGENALEKPALLDGSDLLHSPNIKTDAYAILITLVSFDTVFQPAWEYIHPALFRPHAYFLSSKISLPGNGSGKHPRRDPWVAKEYAAAFWRLETHVVDTTEMTVCVVVDLIGSTGWADIHPGLMMEDYVGHVVLRFGDAFAYLQNSKVHVLELFKVLKDIGALPAFHIGIAHPFWIIASHSICQFQYFGIEALSIVKQGGPD